MLSLRHGMMAALLFAVTSPSLAETFVLTSGEVITGAVVRSLGKTLSIRYVGAGMRQLPISSVERVEIAKADGGIVSGRLLSWSNGVYRLSTDDQGLVAVDVKDGVATALLREGDGETAAAAPAAVAGPGAETAPATTPDAPLITAGFIYASPIDDAGRTFMHEKGRLSLAENAVVDDTLVLEIASEEEGEVKGAVDQLVADGANVVFMTGHNSAATIASSADQHSDVRFVHCGAFSPSPNIDVVCGRIYQARYLSGMIAGGMTESGLIGYVAAEPTPETIIGINAFTLGVQSISPDAQVIVHWTRSWYAPGDEQRRAAELADRGIDVLTIHQDSPAALQVAEQRGINAIGYQSDMRAFAPSTVLTSAVWDWGRMYDQIVDQLNDGTPQLRPAWLGLRDGVIGLAPISDRVPEELRRLVQQRQREMIEGRFNVFTGPISDVDGDVRILDGRTITDERLLSMDYLVEGVIGY